MSGDFRKSAALLQRARVSEALIDARPAMYFTGYERAGGQPLFVERAKGPHLWDVDGNRLVDFLLGYGTVILGHAHPEVIAAATSALELGVNPTLLSRVQIELAERLVAMIPAAEQVTFLKTGSDAVGAAVRLARGITGRRFVFQWGVHGWHDWCASRAEGILSQTRSSTIALRYNDIDHARKLFARHRGDVACVVVMPYELDPPEHGFLPELQALAHRNGALFILDEVRSGFRIALGGAQEYFSLTPDLAAFGKALSNGHSLSVLAGRREVMRHILKVAMTVTYYRSPDAMAAALATLNVLERESGPQRLVVLGRRLIDGLNLVLRESGVPGAAVGYPATPFIRFDYPQVDKQQKAMRLFCNGMLQRGVLLTPAHHWFLCTQMEEQDIDFAVQAAAEVLAGLEGML